MSQPQPIDVPQQVEQNPQTGDKPEDVRGKSQGQLVRQRFFGNTGAVVSLIVLLFIVVLSVTSLGVGPIPGWWKWNPDATGTVLNGGGPRCPCSRPRSGSTRSARTTWAVTCSPWPCRAPSTPWWS